MSTATDPLADLRASLRELHASAGRPSLEELRCHADRLGRSLPTSTANDLLTGRRIARWSTVETFLLACQRHAVQRRVALGTSTVDLPEWRSRYDTAARRPAPELAAAAADRPAGPPRQVPAQLPAGLATFTGRTAELDRLDAELARARSERPAMMIALIAGTAGVGKTSLAIRWAQRVRAQFPDGQLYANLRGYDPDQPTPAADALAGFLRALGMQGVEIPADPDDRAAAYRTALDGRRVLVVLDNASSLEQVQPLLPGTPGCAVLVTTRDSLPGLVVRHGASRLDLDLLPGPEALALLRALVGDRVDADPQAAAALADRCARLPLALCLAGELAVSRPGDPLAALVEGLADHRRRLDLLDAGGDPRTAVHSVFSWSYRHLPEPAARAFRLLGLHPGPDFDPYATAALLGTDLLGAHRLLDHLARVHLIEPTGTDRYGMHDLLRAYAVQAAGAHDPEDDRRDAGTRLLDYYQATTSAALDLLQPAKRDWRPRPAEFAGPVPALDARTARAWLDSERAVLLRACVHAAIAGWPEHAIGLARTLGGEFDNHPTDGIVVHRHARDAADRIADQSAKAYALLDLAYCHLRVADYPQAVGLYAEANAAFRQTGDEFGIGRAEGNLGLVHLRTGLLDEAVEHFRRAHAVFQKTGARASEATALSSLGLALRELGRYDEAVEVLTEALQLRITIGDRTGRASTLENLGDAWLAKGRPDEAERYLTEALAACAETGDRSTRAYALGHLARIEVHRGDHSRALDALRTACDEMRALHDRWGEALLRNQFGETLLAAGDTEQARTEHTAAQALAIAIGDDQSRARADAGLDACDRRSDPRR